MGRVAIKSSCMQVGERLVAMGMIDAAQLRGARERQRATGAFLEQSLAALGFANPTDLAPYLEASAGYPYVDLATVGVSVEAARQLPKDYCLRNGVLAFAGTATEVCVAMTDPLDLRALSELRLRLRRRIRPYVTFDHVIISAIDRTHSPLGLRWNVRDEDEAPESIDADKQSVETMPTGEAMQRRARAVLTLIVGGLADQSVSSRGCGSAGSRWRLRKGARRALPAPSLLLAQI